MTLDFDRYAYLKVPPIRNMDALHVQMLHDLLLEHQPHTAMEIGCCCGFSTLAFVAALDEGAIQELHLVEPTPQPSLRRLIAESGHGERITLHTQSSWDLRLPADFVFIDGDHRWPALADALNALTLGADVIAFHDTRLWEYSSHPKSYWGAHLAAKLVSQDATRVWSEDAVDRPGMATRRGFGWSVKKKLDSSPVP